jgi:SAM-dependent methyltransferase
LLRESDHLVSEVGHRYPIINGKPILVCEQAPLHVTPPASDIVSKNSSEFKFRDDDLSDDAIIVHLGCGDVPSRDPRVISIDILPTMSADLVAEAEYLPFADNSIDHLVSGAVFEHLYNPMQAAAEVRRIIKEGGRFYIDTAFMQGYHGFPSHFFNMTAQAVETFLVDDFILDACVIPDSGSPLHAVSEVLSRFLDGLAKETADRLLGTTLRDVLSEIWADKSFNNPLVSGWSEHSRRALAASVVALGRKPAGYNARSSPEAKAIRRNYYTARATLMLRYHEILLYRLRAKACAGVIGNDMNVPPLEDFLVQTKVTDTMNSVVYYKATQRLDEMELKLREIRDYWISLLPGGE